MDHFNETKQSESFEEMYEDWKETFVDEIGYEIMDYCRTYNPLLLSKGCVYDLVNCLWNHIDYDATHMELHEEDDDSLSETEEVII